MSSKMPTFQVPQVKAKVKKSVNETIGKDLDLPPFSLSGVSRQSLVFVCVLAILKMQKLAAYNFDFQICSKNVQYKITSDKERDDLS